MISAGIVVEDSDIRCPGQQEGIADPDMLKVSERGEGFSAGLQDGTPELPN